MVERIWSKMNSFCRNECALVDDKLSLVKNECTLVIDTGTLFKMNVHRALKKKRIGSVWNGNGMHRSANRLIVKRDGI